MYLSRRYGRTSVSHSSFLAYNPQQSCNFAGLLSPDGSSFAWILAIVLFVNPAVTFFSIKLTIAAATLCAATDLFIAVVMLRTMNTIKTTYTATQSSPHLNTVCRLRISHLSIDDHHALTSGNFQSPTIHRDF